MFNKGLGNIYKQAQQMQKKMAEAQEQLKELEIEGNSGGGLVRIVVNGKKDILSVTIDESILKEDKEMVEDLMMAAIKQAMTNAEAKAEDLMKNVTGGVMPKMPGF